MAEEGKKDTAEKAGDAAPASTPAAAGAGGDASSGDQEGSGEGEEQGPKVTSSKSTNDKRGARRHAPYAKPAKGAAASTSNNHTGGEPKCRVYVGNLAWSVTWRELKEHMKSQGGVVTRADVLQSHDGRSKGCGIVEFATPEDAANAVENLNNTELMGRQIFVREDRETAGGGSREVEDAEQSKRVYVGNLSWDVAWQDLKDHMRTVGDVQYAEVMTDHDGRSKGCGIVEFTTAEGAKEAIEKLTDTELKGRMIFVREDREQADKGFHHGGGGGGWTQHHSGRGHHHSGNLAVYVGNLAYETSWQDLKDHMRAAGNVDKVITFLLYRMAF